MIMSETLKVGDVVQLKSGGPHMTIKQYLAAFSGQQSTTVICNWFVGTKLETGKFDVHTLILAETIPPIII